MSVLLEPHVRTKHTVICLLTVLMVCPLDVYAVIDSANLLDNALLKVQTAAAGWSSYILARAGWLFWTLATIFLGVDNLELVGDLGRRLDGRHDVAAGDVDLVSQRQRHRLAGDGLRLAF